MMPTGIGRRHDTGRRPPVPGMPSLPRRGQSRNLPLAALIPGLQDLFPQGARGAGSAGQPPSSLRENIYAARDRQVCGPALAPGPGRTAGNGTASRAATQAAAVPASIQEVHPVDSVSITLDGTLYNDPRPFTTSTGTAGVSLWLELPPARSNGDAKSRYLEVIAFGTLATNVAASLRAHDRITVRGDDFRARARHDKTRSADDDAGIRSFVVVTARDISPSLIHESVITGSSARQATRAAAANGNDTGLPAAEQADLKVLAGVTATQS
jgi:Single-strand binding protein family